MSPFFLLLLFLLFIFNLTLVIKSKTSPEDINSLQLIKNSVNPYSITPGSCLSSWDFSFDPCDSAFADHFTCGIHCDSTDSAGFLRVTDLNLDSAGYSGPLSPSVWSFPFLQTLEIAENTFSGPIPPPPSAGGGVLPPSLRRLTLSRNSFSGEIPNLSPALSLQEIYLDNNFLTGGIDTSFSSLASLQRLELQMNNLTGEIPDLTSLTSLYYFDASDNNITGDFPPNLPISLLEISLRNNSLTGPIPGAAISRMPALQVMDLSYNGLSGSVPNSIFDHPALEQLTLAYNRFESIEEPANGGTRSRLVAVDMGHNWLTGFLPAFFASMPRLSAVDLQYNSFTGMIPAEYAMRAVGLAGDTAVPFGRMLLSGNYLFGPIPSPMEAMEEGSAVVSLADNCLFRCPQAFFFCQGGLQKPSSTCREFNPVIP